MRSDPNPYRVEALAASESDGTRSPTARWPMVIWLLLYSFPVIAISSVYLSWIVAWFTISHPPRPSLDDPKEIGGVMDIAYLISLAALVSWPVLTPVGFVASFFCPARTHRSRFVRGVLLAIIYAGVCLALGLVVRADPGNVFEWWID